MGHRMGRRSGASPHPLFRPSPESHVCRACGLPLVQPESATPEGRGWRVVLHCPSCGLTGEQVLDQQGLNRFEEELDKGMVELAAALDCLTQLNMRSYVDRFSAALADDAVLPEDF